MPFPIEFEKKQIYDSLKTGITIDVILRDGNQEQLCPAKIDTGSEVCLFSRALADLLEIDVESGYREIFSTLAGDLIAYQHELELEALGLRFQSKIYFAESYAVRRNLLGRRGFLQLVTFGLNDYDCELYLNSRFG
jgi:hypothetical protein